jgi:hypothetical protein
MTDFETESLRFRATERHAWGVTNPRALQGTRLVPNPYDELSWAMARVSTPHAPCSDLPKEVLL